MSRTHSELVQQVGDCADQLRRVLWSLEQDGQSVDRIDADLERVRQRAALLSDIRQEQLCSASLPKDASCDTSSSPRLARSR